jgi:hypothetical protein
VFLTLVYLFHKVRPENINRHTHDTKISVSLLSKENWHMDFSEYLKCGGQQVLDFTYLCLSDHWIWKTLNDENYLGQKRL